MNALRRSLALLFVLLAATALTTTPVTTAAAESTDQYSLAGVGVIPQQATPNASTNASITFENQTRSGRSVYVASVTLPDGGFVVLKEPGPNGTIVGVSLPLAPGTHHGKITLRGVPGARLNQSRLGENTTLVATLYRDSNGNNRFDGLLASGSDEPYTEDGTPVRDRAHITIPADERATTANITITNQTTNGTTVTVASVTLPDGGYVGIHRGGYNGSNATESMVGATDYLESGTYENVTVTLDANGANRTDSPKLDSGRISAVVYKDTDDDHQFQYVPSEGVEDGPYLENGTPVAASAFVTVERPETPMPTQTQTAEQSAPTPVTTAESQTAEPQTAEQQPAGQQQSQVATHDHDKLTPYGGENDTRTGILDNPLFPLLVLAFAVFAVLAAVGGR